MDGYDFGVFANTLGQHRIAWRNQLIDRSIDLSKVGDLPVEDGRPATRTPGFPATSRPAR
ncbi:hypothetical protein [Nocardioides sp.]|uniref:hypothetical protein n=1 Tax=Nocardioides sp. TaxID=35761 RepID=UPI003784114A